MPDCDNLHLCLYPYKSVGGCPNAARISIRISLRLKGSIGIAGATISILQVIVFDNIDRHLLKRLLSRVSATLLQFAI